MSEIDYSSYTIDTDRDRITFEGAGGLPRRTMDLSALKNHFLEMPWATVVNLELSLRNLGYTFSPGFRNLRPVGGSRRVEAREAALRRAAEVDRRATEVLRMAGTPFGVATYVNTEHISVTYDGNGSPGGGVTVSYQMLAEIAAALVKERVITPDDVVNLGTRMGARLKLMKPTAEQAVEMILRDVRQSTTPADKAREWLTRVTNGVVDILREEERDG